LQTKLERAAFYLTFGSAVSILFSIAVSQILMALALAAVLISGTKLRFPPIKLPLLLFVGGTIVSWLASIVQSALSGVPITSEHGWFFCPYERRPHVEEV